MLIDAFCTRTRGMRKAALLGVAVTPSAVWRSGKVSDEMSSVAPSQRSLSLFRLQINTCAFLLHHQLDVEPSPDDEADTKRSLLSTSILISTQAHALLLGGGGSFFVFFACTHACTPAYAERCGVKTDCNCKSDAGLSVNLICRNALIRPAEKARVHTHDQDATVCNRDVRRHHAGPRREAINSTLFL